MKFDFLKGSKHNDDLILLICTEGYEQLTCKDLFWVVKILYDNEDKIYLPPAKGADFLAEALLDLRKMSVNDVLRKYQLIKVKGNGL